MIEIVNTAFAVTASNLEVISELTTFSKGALHHGQYSVQCSSSVHNESTDVTDLSIIINNQYRSQLKIN
jgi:hypothetical protein